MQSLTAIPPWILWIVIAWGMISLVTMFILSVARIVKEW